MTRRHDVDPSPRSWLRRKQRAIAGPVMIVPIMPVEGEAARELLDTEPELGPWLIQNGETGDFLRAFDPEWTPSGEPGYPCGRVDWTSDIDAARTFDTAQAAVDLYGTQSQTTPVRPDGRPNKPLTGVRMIVVVTKSKANRGR